MFKKIFKNIKKLFINDKNQDIQILEKHIQNIRKNPSLVQHANKRFLTLANDDCALILHAENQCEVIFTKLYDHDSQEFTINEELLMALAIFLKQKGFGEMLLSEFHRLALNKSEIFNDEQNAKEK